MNIIKLAKAKTFFSFFGGGGGIPLLQSAICNLFSPTFAVFVSSCKSGETGGYCYQFVYVYMCSLLLYRATMVKGQPASLL